MNPPTGQGTGDLKPPWPCPGESRSGSLKVLLVISPQFVPSCFLVRLFLCVNHWKLLSEVPKPKVPILTGSTVLAVCWGMFHVSMGVSQGWFQEERFRKSPSPEGPAAQGALPKVGQAVHRLHWHQHKLPKHYRSLFWKKHIVSFLPPPASGHRFHSSLARTSKIIFLHSMKKKKTTSQILLRPSKWGCPDSLSRRRINVLHLVSCAVLQEVWFSKTSKPFRSLNLIFGNGLCCQETKFHLRASHCLIYLWKQYLGS